MSLSRDEILAKRSDLPRTTVNVPDFGEVLIRGFTLGEVGKFQAAQKRENDPLKLYPKLIIMACINEDGSPVFSDVDQPAIEGLPWPAVDAIANAALRLNKMIKDEGDPDPKA